MPKEGVGGGGSGAGIGGSAGSEGQGPRAKLIGLINRWKGLRDEIRDLNERIDRARKSDDSPLVNAVSPDVIREWERELRGLQKRRASVVNDIRYVVGRHPNLREMAVDNGFRADLFLDDVNDERGGVEPNDDRGTGNDGAPGSGTGGGTSGTGGTGGGGGGGGGGSASAHLEGDLLPGERGRHYKLVRFDGETWVVFSKRFHGVNIKGAWRIKPGDMEKHGFEEGAGRQITRDEFERLQVFGTTDEIVRRRGGNKDPFEKFFDDLSDSYPEGASILRNRESLGVLLSGFLEGQDQSLIEARLRKTEWYQNRTSYEREWEMVRTEEEREQILKRTSGNIRLALDELFGTVNWRKHVDEKDVDNFALKIASGRWDEPGQAFEFLTQRLRKRAERIEGTAAWMERQQREAEQRQFGQRPDEVFEQLRSDAIQWLGYDGKPDEATLRAWAEDLAFSRKPEAAWKQYLRQTKKQLYRYLDPDTPFMDFASAYKSRAEEILGTQVSWQDPLLKNFVAKDETGKPIDGGKTAMDMWDFERRVRKDDRFYTSRVGEEEGFRLYNLLDNTFTGKGAA